MDGHFEKPKPTLEQLENDEIVERFRLDLRESHRIGDLKILYSKVETLEFNDPSMRPMLLHMIDEEVEHRFAVFAKRAKSLAEIDVLKEEAEKFPFIDAENREKVRVMLQKARDNHPSWV